MQARGFAELALEGRGGKGNGAKAAWGQERKRGGVGHDSSEIKENGSGSWRGRTNSSPETWGSEMKTPKGV